MLWSERVLEMMQVWTQTQQRMWSSWLETILGIGRAPTPDIRAKIIDIWEQSVNHMLEAQSDWMRMWAENFKNMEGAPENIKNWADQSQEGLDRWNDTQRQLWVNLFDILRKAAPGATADSLEKEAAAIFRTWQESARKVMEQQMHWFPAQVTGGVGKAADPTR